MKFDLNCKGPFRELVGENFRVEILLLDYYFVLHRRRIRTIPKIKVLESSNSYYIASRFTFVSMGGFDKDRIRDALGCQFLLYIHGYFYFSSKSSFLLLGHFEKCDNFSPENVSSCILLFGIWSFKDRLTMPAHHEIADQRI